MTTDHDQPVPSFIAGVEVDSPDGGTLQKHDPHSGKLLYAVSCASSVEVERAITAATSAAASWATTPAVRRGQALGDLVRRMRDNAQELAHCVAQENGRTQADASAEVAAAIQVGEFFSGEGMRLYGRTLTSAVPGKQSLTVRQPLGVAALIVPANTPIANIAWKAFPALVSGNACILKAAEDSPRIALLFARLAGLAGLPVGAFNMLQGGSDTGKLLVTDPRVDVISFTGSTVAGKWIAATAGGRLARVSLELGGKNAFVVCNDAALEPAVHWALASAFSNAGQRCAAASRIVVESGIYDEFLERLLARTRKLRLGVDPGCDLGPVINRKSQLRILGAIKDACDGGSRLLAGGKAPTDPSLAGGFYVEPTLIDHVPPGSIAARTELFGPVAALFKVDSLEEALALANSTEYGLTSAIHTRDVDRALWFAKRVRSGVANVNIGTYGSEPHMPFGGLGSSGNGTREPGVEALDVYTELKNISILTRDELVS